MAHKQCAAEHCDVMFERKAARKFCDLHRGAKNSKSPKTPRSPKSANAENEVLAYPINLTEPQLDRFWANMTLADKGWAVQTVLDAQDA